MVITLVAIRVSPQRFVLWMRKLHTSFVYNEAIIIIDDFRLFGVDKSNNKYGCQEDWSQISKDNLLSILQSRIHKVYHLDSECEKDRLIIHINAK